MPQHVLIVSDNPNSAQTLAGQLPSGVSADLLAVSDWRGGCGAASVVIVDIDLLDVDVVAHLRGIDKPRDVPMAFIIGDDGRRGSVQAFALGAAHVIARSKFETGLAPLLKTQTNLSPTVETLDMVSRLNENMFDAVCSGEPLPRNEIERCGELIAHSLKSDGIAAWLDDIRAHHSYTYRHSMEVTGFAVAFGLKLGMREDDLQRLSQGGLLHDIGKARIPIEILDKPTGLTSEERKVIRTHVAHSGEALRADGQFEDEVLDIALQHHEYLDGSGYPDGRSGSDLSDIVRIITIADIFSALIDRRTYKGAIPVAKAYDMMVQMDGKIDKILLGVFGPIAKDANKVQRLWAA